MGEGDDPLKKVQPGDDFQPQAQTWNTFIDAAQDWKSRTRNIRRKMRQARRSPGVVTVKNDSGSDWSLWQPVSVVKPSTDPAEAAPGFAEQPFFPGYDFDDTTAANTVYMTLGITQEPIADGKCGRVAIAGPTLALMHSPPTGWTNYGGWDWVHVFDYSGRFTLRNGPGGDARLLQILDSTLYEDGTYDDQYLVLIDLCNVPNRVLIRNTTGSTLSAHSIVQRTASSGAVSQIGTSTPYHAWNEDLVASPGWDIANGAYGWGYRINDTLPVKVNFALASLPAEGDLIGPANGSFLAWDDLPGMRVHSRDWYKSGETYRAWVHRIPLRGFAKADGNISSSGQAWLCGNGGSPIFDGSVQGGVTYPTCKPYVDHPDLYDPGNTLPRWPNIQDEQVFPFEAVTETGKIVPNGSVMDDPIGTVKLWITSDDPPPGWREYSGLEGRFPVGQDTGDTDFDTLGETGGAKTHTHTTGSSGGDASGQPDASEAADHVPPYRVVRFIERYQ